MSLGGLRNAASGLRARMLILLISGVLVLGLGFEALLFTLSRSWLYQELEFRSRAVASLLAERSLTPLLEADAAGAAREVERSEGETDVVGTAIYAADGQLVAASQGLPTTEITAGPAPRGARPPRAPVVRRPPWDPSLLELVTPVVRRTIAFESTSSADGTVTSQPVYHYQQEGWVRVVMSPRRLEQSLATASWLGVMVLLVALLLGVVAVSWLSGYVVRPLGEASAMVGEIAAGKLDRRLPVRGGDELGTLAQSVNTVASSLAEAQSRVEDETNALRIASRAMMAIARGTRSGRDPAAMFAVISTELRRVTGCEGIALALTSETDRLLHFGYFDPPAPWGGLTHGMSLDSEVLLNLRVPDGSGARLALDSDNDSLSRGLFEDGFRSAMLVPLMLDAGPQAVLLLTSRQLKAFPATKADVVAGLAIHLSAALHVALLNEQLQSAIEELQRTHEYLVQSEMLRVAGEMATGVAHEYNNLLGSVLGRAQLLNLALEKGQLTQEELVSSLRVMERAARDGSEIGRRLRQFGRGTSAAPPEPVNLDAIVLDAIEFTRPRWENEAQVTGRRIDVQTESWSGAFVLGHSNELREVFTNLILNSVDALPKGGTIRISTGIRGDRVLAFIEDDGLGMDEETRKHLFEPFFTTKGEGGSGLGLSVAYGILKRHGAIIDVDSHPGQGTKIEISFKRAHELPRHAAVPSALLDPRSLAVMVVDDDEGVRDVLRDMLIALGHRPTVFETGEPALRDYHPGTYDLIMTDLGMPGITGWKLAQIIRETDPAVTIAFVTGWGDEVRQETIERVAVERVVTKPFTIDDILEVTQFAAGRGAGPAGPAVLAAPAQLVVQGTEPEEPAVQRPAA